MGVRPSQFLKLAKHSFQCKGQGSTESHFEPLQPTIINLSHHIEPMGTIEFFSDPPNIDHKRIVLHIQIFLYLTYFIKHCLTLLPNSVEYMKVIRLWLLSGEFE